jgi:hypothetical protein
MPRKPKPAALKLVEGRSPGRDSGGRVVAAPPRPSFTAPPMPPGLPTPVRREWRRVVAELVDGEHPMPAPAVLAGYCRVLVRQHDTAAALENAVIGSTQWRRLISAETEFSKQIATFCAEYFAAKQPAAPAPVDAGHQGEGSYNPFGPPETWPASVRLAFGVKSHDDE